MGPPPGAVGLAALPGGGTRAGAAAEMSGLREGDVIAEQLAGGTSGVNAKWAGKKNQGALPDARGHAAGKTGRKRGEERRQGGETKVRRSTETLLRGTRVKSKRQGTTSATLKFGRAEAADVGGGWFKQNVADRDYYATDFLNEWLLIPIGSIS